MPDGVETPEGSYPDYWGMFEQAVTSNPPPTLCHYTDFAGLQGILSSGELWATYSRVLNDATEQKYGQQVIKDYAINAINPAFKATVLGALSAPTKNFVTCFCESSRVLSMWQAYANRGGGFCLEFDSSALLSFRFPTFPLHLPFKMSYGTQISLQVREAISQLCAVPTSKMQAVLTGIMLGMLALQFKHPDFSVEQEWRIVVQQPSASLVHFRSGHSDIKPYVKLRFTLPDETKRLPLTRVVYGPTLREDEALKEAIELLLEKYSYGGIPVVSSGIPYRL